MKTKTDQHTDLTTKQFYTILYDRIKLDMAKKSLKVNMLRSQKTENKYIVSQTTLYNIMYVAKGKRTETLAPDNLKNICKALKISVGIVYRLKTKN